MKKTIKGSAAAAMLLAAMAVCFGCSSADSGKVPTPYDEYNLEEYVHLADYSGYKYEMPEISVTEAEIDQRVQVLLKEESTYDEIRTGTVKDGDKIHISYTADCEGERVFTNEGYAVTMGKGYLNKELEEALLGQDIGSVVETSTKIPEDFSMNPTLAGKEVIYTITIEFVYDEHIPALDENFVQSTSEYKTVDEYRESVRRLISEEKMEDLLDEQFETVWTKTVNESEILEYPEGALDTERLYFYSSYGTQLPADADQAEIEKLCEEFAKESVKQKLVLYAIAEAEDLVPAVKVYEAELETYLKEQGYTAESFKETYAMTIYDYALANEWVGDYLYGEVAELLLGETVKQP